MLHHLLYVSVATPPMSERDLMTLLVQARAHNQSIGVSGFMIYHDGNILQLLEGEKQLVVPLFEKIKKDNRHSAVQVLLSEECEERDFTDWSMGFSQYKGALPPEIYGLNQLADKGEKVMNDIVISEKVNQLLKSFRRICNLE